MGMAVPIYYSAEMVRTLPDDGNRYETVFGELLVTPAPRLWHQAVVEQRVRATEYLVGQLGQGQPEESLQAQKEEDENTQHERRMNRHGAPRRTMLRRIPRASRGTGGVGASSLPRGGGPRQAYLLGFL